MRISGCCCKRRLYRQATEGLYRRGRAFRERLRAAHVAPTDCRSYWLQKARAIPHNSKCRYGERGAAAAKPKAQIILDAAKVSAASGGNSEPKQGQRSQSARGFCPRSTMRVPQPDIIEHFGNADAVPQPSERCLSRKAGIVRCCLIPAAACAVPLPYRPERRPRRRSVPRLCRSRRQHRCRAGRSFWHPAHHARGRRP